MKKRKGFTLVELLITLVVLSILTMLTMPYLIRAKFKAQVTGCQMNERNIATSLESYMAGEADKIYPGTRGSAGQSIPSILITANPSYLKVSPTCPASGQEYNYELNEAGTLYTINCREGHAPLNIQSGYPTYSNATSGFSWGP